jgi:hypothetical protein
MFDRAIKAAVIAALVLSASAPAHADVASLRSRLEALGTIAESETDLAHAARAALDRADADRTRGDEASATRAERIAEATLALIERRRARLDAEARLAAARADEAAMRARLEEARAAAASDARERARLDPAGSTP